MRRQVREDRNCGTNQYEAWFDEVLERFLFAGTREGGSRKACLASKGDETDELIYSTSEMVHLDLV